MTTPATLTRTIVATGLFLTGAATLFADTRDDEIRVLRDQIQQLDQKLRVLERKQDIKGEEAATTAKTAAKVTANDKGFTVGSADAANVLRLRALIQADSRWFFNENVSNNDAFVLRRARLIFEGQFNKIYEYQLIPEFGGASGNGTLTLLDANINLAFKPGFQIRAGRFREPVGLEQLQSDSVAFFTERSIVSQFVPGRDLGVQIAGDVLAGKLSYALGVFNGVPDGTNNANNADTNDDKDVAARVSRILSKTRRLPWPAWESASPAVSAIRIPRTVRQALSPARTAATRSRAGSLIVRRSSPRATPTASRRRPIIITVPLA